MTGAPEPDVASGVAEDAFREIHRSLRGQPHPDCFLGSEEIHQYREVFPESVHEAAVPPTGAATADIGLQQHDICTRIGQLEMKRRP